MNFLAPLFFAALAGLAIPVLIHLIQREKKQIQQFPSLMFVRQIPYKSIQRRRIHNWLLLLVRMAALALIIAAFARPFFAGGDPAAGAQGAREVVILLDQSYSIGYGDRWERARAAAHEAVNGLGPSDRGSLVLFSTGAEIALRNSVERDPLTAAIGAAKPGAGATRYAPALKVAGSLLAESGLPRKRSGADQRLPAQRLARRGRRAAAAGTRAHAGAGHRAHRPAERLGDRRVAGALDVLEPGARRGDGRGRQPIDPGVEWRHGDARDWRAGASSRSLSTSMATAPRRSPSIRSR